MTNRKKILLIANAVAVAVTLGWVYSHPAWDSWTALTIASVAFIGLLLEGRKDGAVDHKDEVDAEERGKGGAAIRMRKAARVEIDNRGDIRAGIGGKGGAGGDAILIDDGIDVQIVNNGVIVGGNAGDAVPAFKEKLVTLRYPHESGLQQHFENDGFELAWCNESKFETKLMEGWTILETHIGEEPPVRYRVRTRPEDQILIKRQKNVVK